MIFKYVIAALAGLFLFNQVLKSMTALRAQRHQIQISRYEHQEKRWENRRWPRQRNWQR